MRKVNLFTIIVMLGMYSVVNAEDPIKEKAIEQTIKDLQEEIQSSQIQKTHTLESITSEQADNIFHVILTPIYRTTLSAQVSSPVTWITRRMGEHFNKGDLLIQLDNEVYKANVEKAQAELVKAETAASAKQQLFKDQIASLFEVKDALANVAKARAEVTLSQEQLDACAIIAPYDGKVVLLSIEEHELPQVGQPLIEIVDDTSLIAKILVPSTDLDKIAIGKQLDIHLSETDSNVVATIIRIGAVIEPSSSTISLDAEIKNPDAKLKSGMTGTTSL